jgi:DNA-binding MarR family transcriptional regulator
MHTGKILQDRVREGLAEAGLHHGQGRVLGALSRNRDLSQIEIAEGLHLSRATVTNMVGRMVRDGLVTRRADEKDKRVWRVRLTPAGKKAFERVRDVWKGLEREILASLPPESVEPAHQLLREIRNGLGGRDPEV